MLLFHGCTIKGFYCQNAINDIINEDDLMWLYTCNGVDIEILCMVQRLCGYHKIFLACLINKL